MAAGLWSRFTIVQALLSDCLVGDLLSLHAKAAQAHLTLVFVLGLGCRRDDERIDSEVTVRPQQPAGVLTPLTLRILHRRFLFGAVARFDGAAVLDRPAKLLDEPIRAIADLTFNRRLTGGDGGGARMDRAMGWSWSDLGGT